MGITHSTVVAVADDGTSPVGTNEWNAGHIWTFPVEFLIDGGSAAIAAGVKGDIEMPCTGTITRVTLLADQVGSMVLDLWKDTYANYPPTVADTITASARPTLSSAIKYQDSVLTGWSKSFTMGDILRFNVVSATTVRRVLVSLMVTT